MNEIDELYKRIEELNDELGKEIKMSAQLRAALDERVPKAEKRIHDLERLAETENITLDEAMNIIAHALPRIHASKKNDAFCRDVREWLALKAALSHPHG